MDLGDGKAHSFETAERQRRGVAAQAAAGGWTDGTHRCGNDVGTISLLVHVPTSVATMLFVLALAGVGVSIFLIVRTPTG
jgi:hypothetical protein